MANRTVRGRLILAGLCALVLLGIAAPAVAGGNSVSVTVPKHVRQNVSYSVTLSGVAAHRERLYLFVDYHSCAATPAVEHSRTNGDIWMVSGSYHVTSKGWKSSAKGTDHGCGYLQRASSPLNGRSGILARGSVSYRVH
jgi:hypothetical protein